MGLAVAFPAQAQLATSVSPDTPPDASIAKLLTEAQTLQTQYHESEALAKYEQVLSKAPATYEALWQAAVLSVRIGARYTDETRKAAYFSAARLYANRALVVKSNGAEGHYAEALALTSQATLLTARGRLLAYREMKPHVFMAVARRPDWADAWQLLGRWHYRVDHYSLLERIFSRLFLGGTPSGAGTRKAIDALVRAHELDPKRIQVCYDLARVHLNQGQRSRAVAVLQEAVALTPVTAEELEISRRCRLLLAQLNRQLHRQVQRYIRSKN
ncbi:tetratricopeptide repeat protein [Hymenobacter mucosus]|uniref:Tetratricopeptide repeat-containing protein n=1 Tax=Hymenobacter mucosus TaxID=1411120 RepID=A0A238V867_9BACT|nr:tetratricopeptide repeat protein [Hymenobacter mucosus]SNR30391.1 Tetratricopeptide repeat-containing protein [Hymenobacter mucosus]